VEDAEVCAINCHRAVVEHVVHTKSAPQDDLVCLRGRWQQGGEDRL
jgi:hypothetical protein